MAAKPARALRYVDRQKIPRDFSQVQWPDPEFRKQDSAEAIRPGDGQSSQTASVGPGEHRKAWGSS